MVLPSLGRLYAVVMAVRNRLYDRGLLRSYPLGAKTISIGNLTAGGTGKTPLVALAARLLARNGEKVCVLTRGYGRRNERERVLVSDGRALLADAAAGGDEPAELARGLVGDAIVIADADRVAAAAWARERFAVSAFVLDDAFQHRRARRDLDIVCIDATDPFGGGVIPAGTAREDASGLQRADAVVITRADLVPDIADLRSRITDLAPRAAVFTAENRITRIVPLDHFLAAGSGREEGCGTSHGVGRPGSGTPIAAFCALGNPESFFSLLEKHSAAENAFVLTGKRAFADHHIYLPRDIGEIEALARDSGAAALVTTAKDAVKLEHFSFGLPCYVVEIEPRIDDEEQFRELITSSASTGGKRA